MLDRVHKGHSIKHAYVAMVLVEKRKKNDRATDLHVLKLRKQVMQRRTNRTNRLYARDCHNSI